MSEQLKEALRVIVEHVRPGIYAEITEQQALEIALAYAKGYREGVQSLEENPAELTKLKHTERKGA